MIRNSFTECIWSRNRQESGTVDALLLKYRKRSTKLMKDASVSRTSKLRITIKSFRARDVVRYW